MNTLLFLLRRTLPFILTSLLLLTACKKEANVIADQTSQVRPLMTTHASLVTYIFNWETATQMPSMSNANPVPMPWSSGTSAIDPYLVSDYKKSEGWELVWNTFGPNVQLNDPGYSYFFALYNKYRGILRFYLWQAGTPLATSFIQHGLKLYGSQQSPILNYNAQEIADLESNQTEFSQVLNQQLSLSGGTWFAFQYEMAYDPTLATTSFPAFGLEWDAKWASVSQIDLNGKISGEIKGTVGQANTGAFNFGSFITKAFTTLWGAAGYNVFLRLIGDTNDSQYVASMGNASKGIVKDFLNAVIGGSAGSLQPVNLTLSAKIGLQGTLITGGGIINKKLVLPGQSNSQTVEGNLPVYNSTMGIMNLSNAPIVNIDKYYKYFTIEDPSGGRDLIVHIHGLHTLDNNSFTINWNPAIINNSADGATIQNLNFQLIKAQYSKANNVPPYNEGYAEAMPYYSGEITTHVYAITGTFSKIEQSGNLSIVSGIPGSTAPLDMISTDEDFGITAVRISFDVVPNNGAPRCKLVKTFKAKTTSKFVPGF